MSSLYLIGFIQTIFLSILILTKKKLKLSDIFLFFFILVMGLRLLNIYFGEIGYYELYPKIARLIEFIYWPLFGPLLYLYIEAIISSDNKFKIIYLVHFIPGFIVLVVFAGFIYNNEGLSFNEYCQRGIFFQIGKFFWYYTTHLYYIFSLIKLHRYRRRVEDYFSSKKDVDLKWLLIMTYGFGLFLFTSMFFILTHDIIPIELPAVYYHFSWLVLVIYIFGIGFFGYKQKGIFDNEEKVTFDAKPAESGENIQTKSIGEGYEKGDKQAHYRKTRLRADEQNVILRNLNEYMNTEKPYLDYELDLRSLSEKIDTTPNKLSQIINSSFNKNFFEYVNEHRIEEVKKHLIDPQFAEEKIMNIAYDCGFNSKSSFFSVFKRLTSQTPAEYKNKHLTK